VTAAQLQQWCCSLKQALADLLVAFPPGNCALFDLLATLRCPDAATNRDPNTYRQDLAPILAGLGQILGELLRHCLCGALLPPCPGPVTCNCVPLATVKVRKADCKVLSVCNWTARKFVVTFPDLIYWLEWTGLFQRLRDGIEALCCRPFAEKLFGIGAVARTEPAREEAAPGAAASGAGAGPKTTPFANLFSQSWLNRDRTIDARTLGLALVGATDTAGQPLATAFETDNPGPFLFINQVLRPALEATLPAELTQLLTALASQQDRLATAPAASPPDELAALRRSIAELQAALQAQAEEIARLKNR
jgi:hypothetical protein